MKTTGRQDVPNPTAPEEAVEHEEHPPRLDLSARNLAGFAIFVLLAIVALYFLLPQVAGLEETWHRIEDGSPFWLALALLFTFGMFVGYVLLFHGVFARAAAGYLTLRESYQICMAGLAATRLFSAGGAGGIVLTAWALRAAGLPRRVVADKTVSFLVLTYLVYTVSLIVFGYGLRFGVFPGPDPFTMTVIPATLALVVTVLGLSVALVPTDFERRLQSLALRHGRVGRVAQRAATVPATASLGIRDALAHLRSRDPALLGAIVYWGVPDRRPVGVLQGVRRPTGVRGARDRLLRRHARQPAAAAGRDRRRGRRDDRRVRGVQRRHGPRRGGGPRLPRLHVLAPDGPRRDCLPAAPQDRGALENRARGATLYKLK